jgi:hypothetical protein
MPALLTRQEDHMKQPLTTFEHRNFRFPSEIWPLLEQLAAETKSMAKRGTNARGPSVNVMMERIARRELILTEARPCALLEKLNEIEEQQRAEQAAEQERLAEQQRLEQARQEQQRRVEAHTQAKQAVRKVPVKMQQVNMFDLEPA